MEATFTILALKILAVIALVLLNGFFVMAEFALVKVRETQLEPLQAQVTPAGPRAMSCQPRRYLSAAQVGITIASLALAGGEPVFAALLGPLMDWLQIHSENARTLWRFWWDSRPSRSCTLPPGQAPSGWRLKTAACPPSGWSSF